MNLGLASGDARTDEDKAVAVISVEVDFGVTQVVDGNWGIHARHRYGNRCSKTVVATMDGGGEPARPSAGLPR